MRLLNSTTLELEEFFDSQTPKYAILSHRWLDEEVTFSDMQNKNATGKLGYAKLKSCCEQAVKDGLQHVWIDTCCIDKSSSAELTEAINSMYRWYQNAEVCYAYMADVQSREALDDSSFEQSVWFTRGWTLQELIAPQNVEFYNADWKSLGSKESLKYVISNVAGIDLLALEGVDPESFSIAKRMTWASKRTTTRIEDMAYSLLGIFGVNMPMLYGEGDRAFIRLQEEILKNSDDQSLFAWKKNSKTYQGLLASSPSDFTDCGNIVPSPSKWNRIPYSITNMGLSIQMPMIAWAMEKYFAALDCELEDTPNSRIGIFLEILPKINNQYARIHLEGKERQTFESRLAAKAQYRTIYVRQNIRLSPPEMDRMYGFWIRKLPEEDSTSTTNVVPPEFSEVTSWNKWNDDERILKIPTGENGTAGTIWYRHNSQGRVLKLGFDNDFNPVCQFGGNLLSGSGLLNPKSFAGQMDPSWIYQKTDFLYKGDRMTGLYHDVYPWSISMEEQIINGQIVWTLEIKNLESGQQSANQDHICDGCERYITEARFRCIVCPDFDYCDKCVMTATTTHGDHEFQNVRL
ncbi:hypothetical protein B7463_g7988, partial [Scytalidium lignicola]